MRLSTLAALLISGCSTAPDGPDIVVSHWFTQYDSRDNVFQQSYCRRVPRTQTTKLYLSQAEINRLIAAARAAPKGPEGLERVCVTSGTVPEVMIIQGNTAETVQVSLCSGEGSFRSLMQKMVYDSTQLRDLPPTDCPQER